MAKDQSSPSKQSNPPASVATGGVTGSNPAASHGGVHVQASADAKTQAELAKEESKRGGLDPTASAPGDLHRDNIEKAHAPAGDTGRQATTLDDPSRRERLDPVEVAKGKNTAEGGGVSQTSPGLDDQGGEPDLPPVDRKAKEYKPKQFRVKNPQRITVGWKGLEVRLDPGTLVSEDSYGDGALDQFRNGGVLLEEVKDDETNEKK